MSIRQAFLESVSLKIACPYQWGGVGPNAFDCVGLIKWGMRQAGFTFPDVNVGGLVALYPANRIARAAARPGCLYIYTAKTGGTSQDHVMVYLRKWDDGNAFLIGARGGGSNTLTVADATRQGALVSVVKERYWESNLLFVIDPFLGES